MVRHLAMDDSRPDPTLWSRARVITGIGLVAAMLVGVVLLLRSPTAAVPGLRRSTTTTAAVDASVDSDTSSFDSTLKASSSTVTTDSDIPVLGGDPVVVEFVDTSRATVSGGNTVDAVRRLPTTVWHPGTPGPHPLVVFAHGYQVGPMTYARFCAALAAQGYVVAAPSFPLADESRGNGLDREDIPNQAVDVDFVINGMRATDPSVEDGPVAVVGHSDGGTVALLVAERIGAMHPMVGAVIAIAPDSLKGEFTSSPPPLLIIHSVDDETSAFYNSEVAFAEFTGSRWFLALEGAQHLPPIVGGTPWTPVIDQAVALFLNTELRGSGTSDSAALTSELDQLDLSHIAAASSS